MLKFFRSIRQRLLKENKFKNYLLYAIGETLLVMIGILLALQVNNWNERRKTAATLNNTLKTISNDLVRDTLVATQIIKYLEINDEASKRVIKKEVTLENFNECSTCRSLITIYQPYNIQTKGFDILKRITYQQVSEKDSLLIDLSQFYAIFVPNIEKSNERLENEVLRNLESFKVHPWFVDWTQGVVTDEMIAYFVSEDYRKKVAAYNVLASSNHLAMIKGYIRNAKILLEQINVRLEED